VDEETEPGEAARLARFLFFSSASRFLNVVFDTLMITRIA
jgi:hypothetical protein